jgi:hypothetical protein
VAHFVGFYRDCNAPLKEWGKTGKILRGYSAFRLAINSRTIGTSA